MHLIITNIPRRFRSTDLRDFFSEFTEKEAFNCFHFRHRPQSQLVYILNRSAQAQEDSGRDDKANASLSSNEDTSERSKIIIDSNDSRPGEPDPNDPKTVSDSRPDEHDDPESISDSRPGDPKAVSDSIPDDPKTTEESSGIKSGPTLEGASGSHWVNSGLAGLTSLISEKKQRFSEKKQRFRQFSKWPRRDTYKTLIEKVENQNSTQGEKGKSGCVEESECTVSSATQTLSGTHLLSPTLELPPGADRVKNKKGGKESEEEALCRLIEKEAPKRACCVLDLKDEHEEAFFKKYNHKHWVTREGEILPQRCYLLRVDFSGLRRCDATNDDYKTRQELSALSLEPAHPLDLFEFQPPPMMPQGNVGTPTHHFQELIRMCQLPGSLIRKLRLGNPKGRRKRRFSQVPLHYETSVSASEEDTQIQGTQTQGGEDIAFTASGHLIPSSADFEEERKKWRRKKNRKGMSAEGPKMELEKEAEDGAEVEEWERYEPFHEDVTSQDRIKERRFEKELEVTWEKGGSGLVFYTDEVYWRALEGDFDEQTTDEWDVDMSVYYEEDGGDKDARDGLDMITSNQLRDGNLQQSVFKSIKEKDQGSAQAAKKGKKNKKRNARDGADATNSKQLRASSLQQSVVARKEEEGNGSARAAKRSKGERKIGPAPPPTIASFEAHTKGFGRRLMEAMGWKEGCGLGVGSAGIPYALESDGQHPRDRKGFGYHGEKLEAWNSSTSASTRKPQPRQHIISTVFDRPEEADPSPDQLRTAEPTKLTHRPPLIGPAPNQLRTAEPTNLTHRPPLIDQPPHHFFMKAEPTKLTQQPP